MKDLIIYIRERNAKAKAWMAEDPENRYASMITESMDFWASNDIHTIEDFERRELINMVYEYYKDVHGFRPRHLDLDKMTNEQLQAEMASLDKEVEREIKERQDIIDELYSEFDYLEDDI